MPIDFDCLPLDFQTVEIDFLSSHLRELLCKSSVSLAMANRIAENIGFFSLQLIVKLDKVGRKISIELDKKRKSLDIELSNNKKHLKGVFYGIGRNYGFNL